MLFCQKANLKEQRAAADQMIKYLQKGDLESSEMVAHKILKKDDENPYALFVRALATYVKESQKLGSFFRNDVRDIMRSNSGYEKIYLFLKNFDTALSKINQDLKKISKYEKFNIEFALANFAIDVNQDGRIDFRDKKFMQVEYDKNGKELPEDDPRRWPVFNFDHGDIFWAIAYINFQRGAVNLIQAFNLEDLNSVQNAMRTGFIKITLRDKQYIANTKKFLLSGLKYAKISRETYLKETDDYKEWVPNPNQKDHPLPLHVDKKLYQTWIDILDDIQKLITGKEGISIADIAAISKSGSQNIPTGYIDIGRMLSEPTDIQIDVMKVMMAFRMKNEEQVLKEIFGKNYVQKKKASEITKRLMKMKNEVDIGQEAFESKLKYLLWLN